jgi:hypothetical protein
MFDYNARSEQVTRRFIGMGLFHQNGWGRCGNCINMPRSA